MPQSPLTVTAHLSEWEFLIIRIILECDIIGSLVSLALPPAPLHAFAFDGVHGPESNQEAFYKDSLVLLFFFFLVAEEFFGHCALRRALCAWRFKVILFVCFCAFLLWRMFRLQCDNFGLRLLRSPACFLPFS